MNKREQQRLEREKLKQLLDNPRIKSLVDTLIAPTDEQEFVSSVITPVMETKLSEAQIRGVTIGWTALLKVLREEIKNCSTVDEVKALLDKHEVSDATTN